MALEYMFRFGTKHYTALFVLWCVLASAHTLTIIYDFLFPKHHYATTRIGKFHQVLNHYIGFDVLSDTALMALAIYTMVGIVKSMTWHYSIKLVLISLIIVALLVIMFPLVNVWNFILLSFCRNGPYIKNMSYYFPNHVLFEKEFDRVKSEVEHIIDTSRLQCANEIFPNIVTAIHAENKCWKWHMLKIAGKMVGNPESAPLVYNLLSNSADVHNAFISILEGNSEIPPHVGYFKGYLRYHLGITIPDEASKRAYIVVNGERYEWREGEGVMFDDMYYHHVRNPTSQRRVVLFLDIVRRDIPSFLKPMNRLFLWLFDNHPVLKNIYKIQHQKQDSR